MNFKLPEHRGKIEAYLSSLKGWVSIKPMKRTRTTNQNSLYWLWLTCIQQETGNDKNDLHEYFKYRYLSARKFSFQGKSLYLYPSTKELDTAEMKQYLDEIQIFAQTELAINLPDPKDKNFEHFVEHYKQFI